MADLLVKDTSLAAVANAIRAKIGGSSPINFPDGFASEIGNLTDTSDATATEDKILSGFSAYGAAGTKLNGNIPSQAAQTITPTSQDQTIQAGKYLSGAQMIEGVVCTNLIPENVADGVTVKIGTATDDDSVALVVGTHQGGGQQPQLNAPTISVSSSGNQSVISITNPASNGNFVEKYGVYLDGTWSVDTTSTSNIPITTLGNHSVTVKACGTDFEDSPASNAVTINNYAITVTCVDCTADVSNPTFISNNGATATLVFTPNTDLEIRSSSVVISGASVVSVYKDTGTVVIGSATANVTMTVTALEPLAAAILTVTGLGNEDPTTVVFTESGEFDWGFPEETVDGNIFIKIPTMYRRINTVSDNQITSFSLSNKQADVDFVPYPCFLDSDGTTVLPYVLIGKYCSSSTYVMNSVNATPASITLATGRTNARALGTGYQLYDWQIQKLFVDLAMMKAKTVNFNDGSQMISEYLGIEHLNQATSIDGVYQDSGNWYAATNPSDYISSPSTSPPTGYNLLSYPAPLSGDPFGWVMALGYDNSTPFLNYPSIAGGNASKYYCDAYVNMNNNCPVNTNIGYGGTSQGSRDGLFHCDANSQWSNSRCLRLCYKPISL